MHHADADMRLTDLDVAHLLIDEVLLNRFLPIGFQLRHRDVGTGAHVAARFGIWIVCLRRQRHDRRHRSEYADQHPSHISSLRGPYVTASGDLHRWGPPLGGLGGIGKAVSVGWRDSEGPAKAGPHR